MRRACFGVIAALSFASAHCGSQLDAFPLDAGNIDRRSILFEVGTSKNDAYLLYHPLGSSSGGRLAHWDGSAFSDVSIDMAQATTLALLGPQHAAVGGIAVLDVTGTSANDVTSMLTGAASFMVTSSSDGTLYAASMNVIWRRGPSDATFSQLAPPPGGFTEIVAAAPDRLIMIGDGNGDMAGAFYFFDGTRWSSPNLARSGRFLSAAALDDAWALPLQHGTTPVVNVETWNGSAWSDVPVNVPTVMRQGDPGVTNTIGVIALGNHRAAAVVTRAYNVIPPYREILWVTGDVNGLSNVTSVRVYCQQAGCSDGGDFTGRPFLAADGTLFVGPYYGHVSTN